MLAPKHDTGVVHMIGWLVLVLILLAGSALVFVLCSVLAQVVCSRSARWPELHRRYACPVQPAARSRYYRGQSAQFHRCTFRRALDIHVGPDHIQFQLSRWQPHWLIKPIRIPIGDFKTVVRHRGPLGVPVICAEVAGIGFSCSGDTRHRLATDPIWTRAGIRDAPPDQGP